MFVSGLVVVAAAAPAVATAAPTVTAIHSPLAAPVDPARVTAVAAGQGVVAWTERDASGAVVLRTTGATGPRTVGPVTGVGPDGAPELEVGTASDGAAVVAVTTRVEERSTIELVRLSDGTRRTLPTRLRGGTLRGVGIDRGWIYATRATGSFAKRKATLWRARLTGLQAGTFTRIRSAGRTEDWSRIAADRNRVAVLTTRGVRRGGAFAEESWLAGTPRGAVTRVGQNYATDGGYEPLLAAGFTRDGGALITVRNDSYAPAPATITRTPLRGSQKPRTARVVAPLQSAAEAIAYDGDGDLLVAAGPDATGAPVLGTVPAPWDATGR